MKPVEPVEPVEAVDAEPVEPAGGAGFGDLADGLRDFLDAFTAARPDDSTVTDLRADLARWTDRLATQEVPEADQAVARRVDLPARGQAMLPWFVWTVTEPERHVARARFGRWFLGGRMAAHGGAMTLLFDEVLGTFANAGGRSLSRTAYLHVDYRAVTPLDRDLELVTWWEREDGRKRFVRGELRDGDTVCAEAEALFVELRPGQA